MPVKVKCSGCQAALNVPDRARGKAVKCPKCGTAIRVPAAAPAARKPASVAAGDDDDDLFSGLDLGRVEDRSTRVCPKCGTIVGAEDVDCPMCGADLTTGGLGTTQRARLGRKGAAPSEYYEKALRDAWKYLLKKQSLAWKSGLIFAAFGLMAMLCWLKLIRSYEWPLQTFWTFVASVLTLLIPGWVWVMQNDFIKRALEPKRERYPLRFEMFSAVSLGIKAVFWSLIFGFPVWILFGMPGLLLGGADGGEGSMLLLAAVIIFIPFALACWPVAQAHFAMPVTWPGWAVHKVLPDVGRNIGPSLYWATFALLTAIPMIGAGVGGAFFAADDLTTLIETLTYNADVDYDKHLVELAEENRDEPPADAVEGAKRELKEWEWMQLLWPSVALIPVSFLAGFWVVYNARSAALFVKLFRPNIANLIQHEKEYVYVAKSFEERALEGEQKQATWGGVAVMVFLAAALGSAGGLIYATFGENVGYLAGWGTGLFWAGLITVGLCRFGIIGMAFEESALWGWGCIIFDPVLLVFTIKNWAETKYVFVTGMGALFLVMIPGVILKIAGAVAGEAG